MKKTVTAVLISISLIALIILNNTLWVRFIGIFTKTDNAIINFVAAKLLDFVVTAVIIIFAVIFYTKE